VKGARAGEAATVGPGREGGEQRHYYYQSGLHRFHKPLPHQLLLLLPLPLLRC
jgi:hypothetical protein